MSDGIIKYNKKGIFIEFTVIILIVAFIGIPSLLYPFGRDQGVFAYAASTCMEGKVLYKDVFEVKPPLTFLLNAVALHLFGHSMIAIRIFDIFWQCATAAVIILLANVFFRRKYVGILAASLYGLRYFYYSYWHIAQTDGFITLPLATSLLLVLIAKERNRPLLWLSAGFFFGLAVLLKYPIGILLIFLILIILLQSKDTIKTNLYKVIYILMGFCIPIIIFIFYLIANNALVDYLYIQLKFISRYSSGHDRGGNFLVSVVSNLFAYWKESTILMISSMLAFCEIVYFIKNKLSIDRFLLVFWWIAAVTHLAVQNKYYIYHTLPLLAPLAMMVSHWVFIIYDKLSRYKLLSRMSLIYVVSFICLFFVVFQGYPARYLSVFNVVSGRCSLRSMYESPLFGPYGKGDYSMKANLEVSDYIRERSNPDDEIFVWGFESSIYFLSERNCASRFIFNFPLYGKFEWEQFKLDFLEEMNNKKPKFVLIVQNDIKRGVTGKTDDSYAAFLAFQEFHNFVQKEYEYSTTIEDFIIYKLKS